MIILKTSFLLRWRNVLLHNSRVNFSSRPLITFSSHKLQSVIRDLCYYVLVFYSFMCLLCACVCVCVCVCVYLSMDHSCLFQINGWMKCWISTNFDRCGHSFIHCSISISIYSARAYSSSDAIKARREDRCYLSMWWRKWNVFRWDLKAGNVLHLYMSSSCGNSNQIKIYLILQQLTCWIKTIDIKFNIAAVNMLD